MDKVSCDLNLDILCLTEHWMEEDEIHNYVIGNKLKLASAFSRKNKTHGGAAIFTKYEPNNFRVLYEINNLSVEIDCEMACIHLIDVNIVIVTMYRSPKGDLNVFFEIVEKLLTYINRLNKQAIVLGDFNFNFLIQSRNKEHLINLFNMYGLKQTIFEPTRDKNCLDNVFTSLKTDFSCSIVNNHISDHLGQLFSFFVYISNDLVLDKSKAIKVNINDNSLREFRYHLNKESWREVIVHNENVNINFNIFMNLIQYYYDLSFVSHSNKCASKRSSKKSIKNNWYDSELKSMKERLDFLYHLYKSTGNKYYQDDYKNNKTIYRLKVKQAKKQANALYIKNSDNKTKALWNIVNRGKKVHNTNVSFAPEEFNNFFVSVANDKASVNSKDNVTVSSCSNINVNNIVRLNFNDYLKNKFVPDGIALSEFSIITEEEVIKTVKNLASKKSKDHFGLTNNLVKDTIKYYVRPLTFLINNCIQQGVFPDILKITKVHPIFKKGSKEEIGNYRPVAIVPVFSKIIEVIIGKQLMNYLECNNLLCKEQFGFRKGLATTHAIISLVDKVLDCYENKDFAAVTFCDLSKAFDRVSHDKLLQKLEYYKIKRYPLMMIKSYLENRKQYVVTQDGLSDNRDVTDGVPQGSVLGPLLFLVAINDLKSNVPADVVLYADDTTIVARNSHYDQVLRDTNYNVNIVENWLKANNLILNKDKTNTVVFSLREFPDNIEAPNSKFLGLTFDSKLNWHQHTINLKKKLSSSIFALKRLTGEIERESLIQAYYGVFHCHLNYGLIVWGSSSHADEVFILQKRALRVISGAASLDHCQQIFIDFKILTLFSLYIYQCITYLRNNVNKISCRSDVHDHFTRNRNNLNLPYVRLQKTCKGPLIIGSKFYNKLPLALRLLPENEFKLRLKRFLCKKAFYCTTDFENNTWKIQDF